ncbi:MAG: hypothetical protein ABI910_08200 [Gemmatimonadota bacterium]
MEGPEWIKVVRNATKLVNKLEANSWDFDTVPQAFARTAAADVVAKEVLHIHDGHTMTRMGHLVMGGVGGAFNLMGPIPSDSRFMVTDSTALNEVKKNLGSRGLDDLEEYHELTRRYGELQTVKFFNYGAFYTLRDLVFWLLVHDAGCFPSTLETMVRHFAAGHVVQNDMYMPARPSKDRERPALMTTGACMMVQFPSTVIEWMDKPMFGGLAEDTVHIEYLLTLQPTHVSHPYLPLVGEGKVRLGYQDFYQRTFAGVTPKDALRGPGVPAERPTKKRK